MSRLVLLLCTFALAVAGCASGTSDPDTHENPERAVVSWFEAIDAGDVDAAAVSTNAASLALILSIENDLDVDTTAAYLESGVPEPVQSSYWDSFAQGFADFASRPISTLTVGESERFTAEGHEFASVEVSGAPGTRSVVFTRIRDDGTWEVDLVATLADGFATLLADRYSELGSSESAEVVRAAYLETVAPALWAAMTAGSFGDDFNRVALTLVSEIES